MPNKRKSLQVEENIWEQIMALKLSEGYKTVSDFLESTVKTVYGTITFKKEKTKEMKKNVKKN